MFSSHIYFNFNLCCTSFSFQSTIIYCEAKKDENIAKFSDDLNAHIQGIQVIG